MCFYFAENVSICCKLHYFCRVCVVPFSFAYCSETQVISLVYKLFTCVGVNVYVRIDVCSCYMCARVHHDHGRCLQCHVCAHSWSGPVLLFAAAPHRAVRVCLACGAVWGPYRGGVPLEAICIVVGAPSSPVGRLFWSLMCLLTLSL